MTDPERSDAPDDATPAPGPDAPPPLPPPAPLNLSEVLERFKRGQSDADDPRVNDGLGMRPRLNWNPVTDSGGEAPPKRTTDPAFSFNLGQALAKLGLDPDAPVDVAHQPAGDDIPLDAIGDLQRRLRGGSSRAPEPDPSPEATPSAGEPALPSRSNPEPSLDADPAPLARRVPKGTSLPIDDGPAVAAPRPVNPPTPADEPLPTRRAVEPAAEAPLPTREPASPAAPAAEQPLPTRRAPEPVADASLPTRQPVQPDTTPPAVVEPIVARQPAPVDPVDPTRQQATPRRSVFDDVVAPTPTLPPTIVSGPTSAPPRQVVPPAEQPIQSSATMMPGQGVPTIPAPAAPTTAPAPALPAGLTAMPTLPPSAPKVVPAVAAPVDNIPQQVDIRALRSAQIRNQRQQGRRHPVLRAFGILIILGAIGAAALYFGRPLLFPTEWDPALTPVVDEIETERGQPFDHTVGLVQQSVGDFELTVMRLTLGEGWASRVAEWRALGLAGGAPTPAVLAPTVRGERTAMYDPTTDRIYLPDDVTPADAGLDLRLALEQAFDAQLGVTPVAAPAPGLAGVSPTAVIARRAVDQFLVDGADDDLTLWQPTAGVPAPIEYEMLASGVLGAAVLDAAGIDPSTASFDLPDTAQLAVALDDGATAAQPGTLQVGERKLAEPAAIGFDDWSMVLAQRLPVTTVEQLASLVTADSYQPIDRNGVTCVIGTFATATPPAADVMLVELTNWVNAAPVESQATATRLNDLTVQLATCDPGAAVSITPNPDAVRFVINRQLARLAAA